MNDALAVKITQSSEHLPYDDSAVEFLQSIVPVDKGHKIASCGQLCKYETSAVSSGTV